MKSCLAPLFRAPSRPDFLPSIARAFSQKKSFVKIARVPAFLSFNPNELKGERDEAGGEGAADVGTFSFEFHSFAGHGMCLFEKCVCLERMARRILFIIQRTVG